MYNDKQKLLCVGGPLHGVALEIASNVVSFTCTEGPEANAVYKVRTLASRNPNAGVHVEITILAYFGQQ